MNLYGVFKCAFHMFTCMAHVLNFNIHACMVYASCRFEWWHEKLACICYLIILFSSGIELTMVLRMVYSCYPIGIMLQRSIFYTLSSFGRYCLIYFLSKHMHRLQSKLLAHMWGEQLLPYGVHETCPYSFTHGKYAWAKQHGFNLISIHIFVKGLSSITKKGEIESSSLVLVNWWNPRC